MMGTKCNVTSAYHPQSNGQDERFNQTLQPQLLKYVDESKTHGIYTLRVYCFYTVSLFKTLQKTNPILSSLQKTS